MRMRTVFALPLLMISLLLVQPVASAQDNVLNPLCDRAGGSSSVCRENNATRNESSNNNRLLGVAGTVLEIFSYVLGVTAVIVLIIGSVKFVTSAGDSAKVSSARNTVIYALVGVVVALLAQAIVLFVLDRL